MNPLLSSMDALDEAGTSDVSSTSTTAVSTNNNGIPLKRQASGYNIPTVANFTKIDLFRGTKVFKHPSTGENTFYDIAIAENEDTLCLQVRVSLHEEEADKHLQQKLLPVYVWGPSMYDKLDRDQINRLAKYLKSHDAERREELDRQQRKDDYSSYYLDELDDEFSEFSSDILSLVRCKSDREYTLLAVRELAAKYIFDRLALTEEDCITTTSIEEEEEEEETEADEETLHQCNEDDLDAIRAQSPKQVVIKLVRLESDRCNNSRRNTRDDDTPVMMDDGDDVDVENELDVMFMDSESFYKDRRKPVYSKKVAVDANVNDSGYYSETKSDNGDEARASVTSVTTSATVTGESAATITDCTVELLPDTATTSTPTDVDVDAAAATVEGGSILPVKGGKEGGKAKSNKQSKLRRTSVFSEFKGKIPYLDEIARTRGEQFSSQKESSTGAGSARSTSSARSTNSSKQQLSVSSSGRGTMTTRRGSLHLQRKASTGRLSTDSLVRNDSSLATAEASTVTASTDATTAATTATASGTVTSRKSFLQRKSSIGRMSTCSLVKNASTDTSTTTPTPTPTTANGTNGTGTTARSGTTSTPFSTGVTRRSLIAASPSTSTPTTSKVSKSGGTKKSALRRSLGGAPLQIAPGTMTKLSMASPATTIVSDLIPTAEGFAIKESDTDKDGEPSLVTMSEAVAAAAAAVRQLLVSDGGNGNNENNPSSSPTTTTATNATTTEESALTSPVAVEESSGLGLTPPATPRGSLSSERSSPRSNPTVYNPSTPLRPLDPSTPVRSPRSQDPSTSAPRPLDPSTPKRSPRPLDLSTSAPRLLDPSTPKRSPRPLDLSTSAPRPLDPSTPKRSPRPMDTVEAARKVLEDEERNLMSKSFSKSISTKSMSKSLSASASASSSPTPVPLQDDDKDTITISNSNSNITSISNTSDELQRSGGIKTPSRRRSFLGLFRDLPSLKSEDASPVPRSPAPAPGPGRYSLGSGDVSPVPRSPAPGQGRYSLGSAILEPLKHRCASLFGGSGSVVRSGHTVDDFTLLDAAVATTVAATTAAAAFATAIGNSFEMPFEEEKGGMLGEGAGSVIVPDMTTSSSLFIVPDQSAPCSLPSGLSPLNDRPLSIKDRPLITKEVSSPILPSQTTRTTHDIDKGAEGGFNKGNKVEQSLSSRIPTTQTPRNKGAAPAPTKKSAGAAALRRSFTRVERTPVYVMDASAVSAAAASTDADKGLLLMHQ